MYVQGTLYLYVLAVFIVHMYIFIPEQIRAWWTCSRVYQCESAREPVEEQNESEVYVHRTTYLVHCTSYVVQCTCTRYIVRVHSTMYIELCEADSHRAHNKICVTRAVQARALRACVPSTSRLHPVGPCTMYEHMLAGNKI